MPSKQPATLENALLAGLPHKDLSHLLAGCAQVVLVFGDVLHTPGERIKHVCFPTASFISLVTMVDEDSRLAAGLIGREGMLGVPILFGTKVASLYAVVQGAGPALQMEAATFTRELEHSAALRKRMQAYSYVVMSQFAHMAACARFHRVEERLARWLLMTQDRAQSDQLHVTHEFLAYMLGVRRVGITKAATALQKRELISYSRGNITIHDRGGLVAASCGCYWAERKMYDSVMTQQDQPASITHAASTHLPLEREISSLLG